MLEFQQNEQTAERRRWIFVLVDSTDGVTGKTGQTGKVKVSKNGGEPEDSTNNITEVDSSEMPGHYYIELTASELDSLGFVSIYYKAAQTLAFHDRAIVSYNDPYVMVGGFGGGGESGPARLSQTQIKDIAEAVWKHMVNDKVPAGSLLVQASDHPTVDLSPITEKISNIPVPTLDLEPVLSRIDAIRIPQPRDYTTLFQSLQEKLDSMGDMQVQGLNDAIKEFTTKMEVASEQINGSLVEVDKIKKGFEELTELVGKFNEAVSEATDMDRRFENMTSVMQQRDLQELSSTIQATMARILEEVINSKHDIIDEVTKQ